MKNRMIQVGTCVPSLHIGDVNYNVLQTIKMMEENKDCSILVFPELSLTGYTCGDLFFQNTLLDACLDGLQTIKQETLKYSGMVVIVGFPYAYKGCLYNMAAVLVNGEIIGLVPKSHIPNYNEFYESRYFNEAKDNHFEDAMINGELIPTSNQMIFKSVKNDFSFAVEVCEDLWVPLPNSTNYALQGVDLVLNLSASNEYYQKKNKRKELVMHQSSIGHMAYVYCSSGSDESTSDLVFSGHCIVAQDGELLNEMIYPEANTCMKTILDLDRLEYDRLKTMNFDDASLESKYKTIVLDGIKPYKDAYEIDVESLCNALKEDGYKIDSLPFIPKENKQEAMLEILNIQARGLLTRLHKTGMKNMVLGVSGGLDSTLALIVCHIVTTLDPTTYITAVTMPSKGNTSSRTYKNALDLIQGFNANLKEVEIGDEVVKHLNTIGHPGSYQGQGDTTYENAQARMRTYILMDLANYSGGLVIGTGDLSELALGWCTYNGDHMSMYSLNCSIPKTLVKFLCYEYAMSLEDGMLKDALISVVETPISPELTPSKDGAIAQKTEDTVGKYDLNDFYLYEFMHYGYGVEHIVLDTLLAFDGIDLETIKKTLGNFYRRFFTQQFKRNCVPDGVKAIAMSVSPRGDLRMPSDASYQMYQNILNNL